MSDAWTLTPRASLCWPDPAAVEGFGPATAAVRTVVAQAASVTGPVHGLLCEFRTWPWWQDTGDLYEHSSVPHKLVDRAGRAGAHSGLYDQLSKACDAAGWWGGFTSAKGTSGPQTVLAFALLGAIISDVDPFRAELLVRMWADAMPPAELTDPATVLLWCRIRAGGATREEALTAVRGVLAAPVTPTGAAP